MRFDRKSILLRISYNVLRYVAANSCTVEDIASLKGFYMRTLSIKLRESHTSTCYLVKLLALVLGI